MSDVARETTGVNIHQDPLEAEITYGAIINKAAKRLSRRRPLLPTASISASKPAKASSLPSGTVDIKEMKNLTGPNVKPEAKSSRTLKDIPSGGSQERRSTSVNPLQLKRDSSSIFKSFAKAKPLLKREGTDSSAGASGIDSAQASGLEDELMEDTSDGEDDYMPPSQNRSKEPFDASRKSQKEREAALKKMMEDDKDQIDEPDIIQEDVCPEGSKDIPASQPTEEAIQVTGGRRRGRRKVMKKKTIKDEEGYLGTFTD